MSLDAPARALIADDERLMREQLRARLAEVWPALEIVAEARNGLEAVQMTESLHPEIVFLDIRMPGLTGIDAARQIAQLPTHEEASDGWPGCEVVFITAYDQYAVEAFEQGVVDYVLKPAERDRLGVTVERVRKRLALRRSNAQGTAEAADDDARADGGPTASMQQLLHKLSAQLNPAGTPAALRWIQATVGQSIQMIPVEDVLFFISDEKYTRVQTATLEALIRKPIKELVDELDPDLFWQIHRSTLVNTRCIAGVSRDLRGRQLVAVKGHPEKLEVSRSFTGLFKGM
ncbi:MAG: LytTR family DNA-binding domain-containing protein [Burkholderiaceae bacterium]